MKYTLTEGQSFDPEILRQELVADIGPVGWYINTSGNMVEFVGDGFDPEAAILAHFDNGAVREQAKLRQQIKGIREAYLERFPKNSGVDNVYVLNYQAATLGVEDTTTILRNGKAPATHLGDFGVNIGMTAAQFAAYVLSENLLAGQRMTEIEAEYLRLYYDGPLAVLDVDNYKAYCDARIT